MATSIFTPHTVQLTICGVGELPSHATAGVTHVLSILDPGMPDPAIFQAFPRHRRESLRFHDTVTAAAGDEAPQEAHVEKVLQFGADLGVEEVGHLLIHCYMGFSRSTAAAAIVLAQHMPAGREQAAFDRIMAVRPRSWPNARMVRIADRLLDRGGALVAAMTEHHRRVLARHPEVSNLLVQYGRPNQPGT